MAPRWLILGLLAWLTGWSTARGQPFELEHTTIEIDGASYPVQRPKGFELEFLAAIPGARLFVFSDTGMLIVGSNGGGVYELAPPYSRSRTLLSLGERTHSVALRDAKLYVAATSKLVRIDYPVTDPGGTSPETVAELPVGGHSARTVHAGPDGRIYVSLGISGNCSDEHVGAGYPFARRRGGLLVLNESAQPAVLEPFVSGLRNPIDFAWHPATASLYATNAGPDHWGYELPREVFARLAAGSFHGMPWFQFINGQFERDDCIGVDPPGAGRDPVAPAWTFAARSTPIGVAFGTGQARDFRFTHNAVLGIHGSWATLPDGDGSGDPRTRRPPKVVMVEFAGDEPTAAHDLVTGFQLGDGQRWARPAGTAFGPDGELYFTSDGGDVAGLFRLRSTAPPPDPDPDPTPTPRPDPGDDDDEQALLLLLQ